MAEENDASINPNMEEIDSNDMESEVSVPESFELNQNVESSIRRNEPCMICTDDMIENDLYFLQCFHKFHTRCISRWLTVKQQCPICKFPANIDIVGVDEHGNFLSSTGHTITNGIIEDREALVQESMGMRISRAIDLLREMHSQTTTLPPANHPARRRFELQVNVDSQEEGNMQINSSAAVRYPRQASRHNTEEHITDNDNVDDTDDFESTQSEDISDWNSLLQHVQRPVAMYSSRRIRTPYEPEVVDYTHNNSQEIVAHTEQHGYSTQDESENAFRSFGPIDDDGKEENTNIQWVDNILESIITPNSQSTPLLQSSNTNNENICENVQLSQQRTPSPYPIFSNRRRSHYEFEYFSLYEQIGSNNVDINRRHTESDSSGESEFTYDSDGDTHTDDAHTDNI